MATIDADAHVLEQPKTWSYMRDFEQQYVPMIVTPVDGPKQYGPQGNLQTEFWVVDGKIHNKQANMGLDTTVEAREMRDIQKRLDHMDELKVDVQVLYPTVYRPCFCGPTPISSRPSLRCAAATTAGSRKSGRPRPSGCAGWCARR